MPFLLGLMATSGAMHALAIPWAIGLQAEGNVWLGIVSLLGKWHLVGALSTATTRWCILKEIGL